MSVNSEPLILGIDSANSACSVALVRGDNILGSITKEMTRGQAEELLVMADDILKKAKVEPSSLDCVGVTVGPGSFTGLRIGLSAARGLALSISRPCIGVTTFETVANGIATDGKFINGDLEQQRLLVAIETRREDFYVQLFDGNFLPLSSGAALHEDELVKMLNSHGENLLENLMISGDGATRASTMLKNQGITTTTIISSPQQSAVAVCKIAKTRYPPDVDAQPPQPLYLRPPEAKIPPPHSRAINIEPQTEL